MTHTLRSLLDPGDWRAIKPKLDPQASVLEIRYVPAPGDSWMNIGGGLFFLALAFVIGYFIGGVLLFGGFALAFVGLFKILFGLLQRGFSLWVTISASDVAVERHTRFGEKRWREPLQNYRGVLLSDDQTQDLSGGSQLAWSKDYHVIELAHSDPSKSVPLHVTEGGSSPRAVHEAFARRFGLPALAPDLGRETALTLRTPAPKPGPPPSGVTLREQDGTTTITVGSGRIGKSFVWVFWICLPLATGAFVYQLDPVMGYFTAGAVTIGVLVLLGIGELFDKHRERSIRIDADRVWVDQKSLPRKAVEQVRVDLYTGYMSDAGDSTGPTTTRHPRLLIEAEGDALEYIGAPLDEKKLQWVRDYLLYRLTN